MGKDIPEPPAADNAGRHFEAGLDRLPDRILTGSGVNLPGIAMPLP